MGKEKKKLFLLNYIVSLYYSTQMFSLCSHKGNHTVVLSVVCSGIEWVSIYACVLPMPTVENSWSLSSSCCCCCWFWWFWTKTLRFAHCLFPFHSPPMDSILHFTCHYSVTHWQTQHSTSNCIQSTKSYLQSFSQLLFRMFSCKHAHTGHFIHPSSFQWKISRLSNWWILLIILQWSWSICYIQLSIRTLFNLSTFYW